VRFLIVGDGDLQEPLRRQAEASGLGAHVVFAGHRKDVPEMLGAIDVLSMPSLYEGTPLALFEAMAAGKAIVASAVDGCAEVLQDGTTGLLVPPGDAPALGEALCRAIGEVGLRQRLGRSAREASGRYDIEATVRRIEGLYEEVLAERRPARAA
jgi:glycosyltransferase involved in cell wall biosynthesis